MKPALVAQEFDVEGRLVRVVPTGSGNVNDTYLAIFRTTFSEFRFIVQKLNQSVFKNPADVMHNMRVVTEHVHRRLEQNGEVDRIWQLPRIIPTRDGKDFLIDDEGVCWRAISLIASATAFDKIRDLEHAHEVGYVLGNFQRLISDIPVEDLTDTLPGFHVTPLYLETLDRNADTEAGRKLLKSSMDAQYCYQFINKRRQWASVLEDARERGELAIRPVHGDPKVANVMIDDETGLGTCIIDLDTVKPGLLHYDFGDCMRSSCNPAGEETKDHSEVSFDIDYFESITRGYMTFAKDFLTDVDRSYLYDAIRLITFELGVRFFGDFIGGDKYFKTKYEGHNLNRALVQLKLCSSIEKRESVIRRILERD